MINTPVEMRRLLLPSHKNFRISAFFPVFDHAKLTSNMAACYDNDAMLLHLMYSMIWN